MGCIPNLPCRMCGLAPATTWENLCDTCQVVRDKGQDEGNIDYDSLSDEEILDMVTDDLASLKLMVNDIAIRIFRLTKLLEKK